MNRLQMKILIEDVFPIKAVIPGIYVNKYIPLSDLLAFLPACWSLSCQCIFDSCRISTSLNNIASANSTLTSYCIFHEACMRERERDGKEEAI